jgi:hypothetical protein
LFFFQIWNFIVNPDTHLFQNVYDFHATDESSNFIQDGIYLVCENIPFRPNRLIFFCVITKTVVRIPSLFLLAQILIFI